MMGRKEYVKYAEDLALAANTAMKAAGVLAEGGGSEDAIALMLQTSTTVSALAQVYATLATIPEKKPVINSYG